MKNNWFKDMEKITICIGFAIVYLGINNMYGDSIISPALVTGISLSGLCLTIADFLSKQFKNSKNKILVEVLSFIDFLLYILAACFILGYPNSTFVKSLDKDTLDSMSTTASVIALGFVFIAIGISNRKAVLEEEKKRSEEIESMLADSKKILEQVQQISENEKRINEKSIDLQEKMFEIIEEKDKQIEELEKKMNILEKKKSTASA